jgi:hypothetical protein
MDNIGISRKFISVHHESLSGFRKNGKSMGKIMDIEIDVPLPRCGPIASNAEIFYHETGDVGASRQQTASSFPAVPCMAYLPTIWLFNIAMENHHF